MQCADLAHQGSLVVVREQLSCFKVLVTALPTGRTRYGDAAELANELLELVHVIEFGEGPGLAAQTHSQALKPAVCTHWVPRHRRGGWAMLIADPELQSSSTDVKRDCPATTGKYVLACSSAP